MDRRISLTVALPAGMLSGPRLDAAEFDYRFVSVRTIDGPCCRDGGSDIVVEGSDAPNAAAFSPADDRLYVTGCTKLGADFGRDAVIESESACHQLGDVYLADYDVED